jgi:hypothetical protein
MSISLEDTFKQTTEGHRPLWSASFHLEPTSYPFDDRSDTLSTTDTQGDKRGV